MDWRQRIAFTGAGVDRAAALRGDAQRQAALFAGGRILPLWRGKPLLVDGAELGWLPAGHPVLADAPPPVFLGLTGDIAHFAQDVSGWVPDAGTQAVQPGFFDPSEQTHPALPDCWRFAELRGAMQRLAPDAAALAATARAVLLWHLSHRFCAACGAASSPAQAGWQRVCPACAATHFPRTDPVVIMLVTRGNRLLLGRSPGWPPGMYSCLAGFVEPGETIEDAVRREVAEETGVVTGRVTYLASQPWPFPASLMIGCRAEALSDTLTIDPAEIEDALWLTREEMVAVMDNRHPVVRPARPGAIAHALIAAWLADRLD